MLRRRGTIAVGYCTAHGIAVRFLAADDAWRFHSGFSNMLLSLVIPIYNEEEALPHLFSRTARNVGHDGLRL